MYDVRVQRSGILLHHAAAMNFEFVLTDKMIVACPIFYERVLRRAVVEFDSAYRHSGLLRRTREIGAYSETWSGYFPVEYPQVGLEVIACILAITTHRSASQEYYSPKPAAT